MKTDHKLRHSICVLSFCTVLLLPCWLLAQTPEFDIVITNGHIIDGTGSPWYSGDVGIRDGKIAAIDAIADPARLRQVRLAVLDEDAS